ncbi:MAG: tyrosine-type recombinase/integrase, partial [Candidatus Sumerlaeota bacterium]|nr:tyrosine-type recombinase/integrase [Candidatus Sumerlaeota bacterium]
YDLRGKKVRLRVGPSRKTAEIAKGDVEARLAKQRAGLLDPDKELRRTTLESFRDQLPEFLQTENRAPQTIIRYAGVFKRFSEFVEREEAYLKHLDQVNAALIERYKDFRRREPISPNGHPNTARRDGVSVRTVNNELTFLHSMFNLARRRQFIQSNPFEQVRKIARPTRKRYAPLTEEQIERLIQAADGAFRPILLTFLLTGMRTGELLNLEWIDVDFERDELHIRAKRDWEPKDREARAIPLHGRLKAALEQWKPGSDSRYVFGHGEKPCPNKLLPRLHSVCRKAGIPPITVHTLRDEFASHLVMRGVGIETVCQLLGHSDIKITWAHYIHLAPQKIKEAVERLQWGQTVQSA